MKKQGIVGIDLGGTKIALALVHPETMDVYLKKQIATFEHKKMPESTLERSSFFDRFVDAIMQLIREGAEEGIQSLPYIGIGSPGNIHKGVIKKGTTPQLGPYFDEFPIEEELKERLSKLWTPNIKVVVRNDALAQMAFGIADLVSNKKVAQTLNSSRIAFIGPGTGLGGGFAWLTMKDGKPLLDFFTDGHIGDIIVGRDEAGEPLWAEFEYISGLYIAKKTNGLSGKDLAKDIDSHRELILEMGQNLGKLIELIHLGEVYKARASTFWTTADRESVKGIRFFVIGGSIGSKGEMGKIIRKEAETYLKEKLGDRQIELFPLKTDSADAGVLGAAQFMLPFLKSY
jgi:predicted NBD/HSP70 family sugar kinase